MFRTLPENDVNNSTIESVEQLGVDIKSQQETKKSFMGETFPKKSKINMSPQTFKNLNKFSGNVSPHEGLTLSLAEI